MSAGVTILHANIRRNLDVCCSGDKSVVAQSLPLTESFSIVRVGYLDGPLRKFNWAN
jgi:hypothetical protein